MGGSGQTQTHFGPHARQAPIPARNSDAFWNTDPARIPVFPLPVGSDAQLVVVGQGRSPWSDWDNGDELFF